MCWAWSPDPRPCWWLPGRCCCPAASCCWRWPCRCSPCSMAGPMASRPRQARSGSSAPASSPSAAAAGRRLCGRLPAAPPCRPAEGLRRRPAGRCRAGTGRLMNSDLALLRLLQLASPACRWGLYLLAGPGVGGRGRLGTGWTASPPGSVNRCTTPWLPRLAGAGAPVPRLPGGRRPAFGTGAAFCWPTAKPPSCAWKNSSAARPGAPARWLATGPGAGLARQP
jgi:hypothetical protein